MTCAGLESRDLAGVGALRARAIALCALLSLAACSHSGAPPSLGDSLSVEQAGGSATELIATGTQLPTSATESFTTSRDGETKLYIHVLRGAARKAGNLTSDGWWQIDGVAGGPAGQAQVFVTFELDAKADLTLSARQEAVKLKVARLVKPPESAEARAAHRAGRRRRRARRRRVAALQP